MPGETGSLGQTDEALPMLWGLWAFASLAPQEPVPILTSKFPRRAGRGGKEKWTCSMRRKDTGWLGESSETSRRKGQRDRKGREVRPKEEAN